MRDFGALTELLLTRLKEGRKYRKTTFPSARGLWRISQRLIELGLSAKKTGAKVKT